jgi:hypothetical protein
MILKIQGLTIYPSLIHLTKHQNFTPIILIIPTNLTILITNLIIRLTTITIILLLTHLTITILTPLIFIKVIYLIINFNVFLFKSNLFSNLSETYFFRLYLM